MSGAVEIPEGFTPGPWELRVKPHFGFQIVNPSGDAELGNWLIAEVRWAEDAGLFFAAPEMAVELLVLRADVTRLTASLAAAEAEAGRLRLDCVNLIANLDHFEEVTGEGPQGEDRDIVEEIRVRLFGAAS